jgi:hypothetical protein
VGGARHGDPLEKIAAESAKLIASRLREKCARRLRWPRVDKKRKL